MKQALLSKASQDLRISLGAKALKALLLSKKGRPPDREGVSKSFMVFLDYCAVAATRSCFLISL